MERESAVLKHRTVVQPFIKDAFKEGAHKIKPKWTSEDGWSRQKMIGVVYNDIGSTATLEELAVKYDIFKQHVSEINKIFLRNLYNNGSPELKDRYLLSEILTARKPRSQRSRERESLNRGGTSLRIKAQVESGARDIDTINKNTGIPKKIIRTRANKALKDWGIDIPRKYASYRGVLVQLDKETDDERLQELLDRLPYHVVLRDMRKKKGDSQFYALTDLIWEAGLRPHIKDTHFFATSLQNAGVPVSGKDVVVKGNNPQTLPYYYILLTRHKGRAIKVLKEDQSHQRLQR